MTLVKLALRNLIGAGLRTWLNVIVLSLCYVIIIWVQGVYDGMNTQATRARVEVELGGGQYWHKTYDPFDPFALQDAHAPVVGALAAQVEAGKATPVLIRAGSMYPSGRLLPVHLKGIDPNQQILDLESDALKRDDVDLPVMIGKHMAKKTGLKVGDGVMVRWRDAHGAFDAREAQVVHIMETDVMQVDQGQMWLPIEHLRQMADMPDEATIVVMTADDAPAAVTAENWEFKDLDFLLLDLRRLLKMKTTNARFLYGLLLFMACLAIFNGQVLSLFRRYREIGTLIAMGMTRSSVIGMFTLEGCFNAVLAALLGAVYGVPLLVYTALYGIPLPQMHQESGFMVGAYLYPSYSVGLVLGTTAIVFLAVTVVSFMPTRRIAKMRPTDALRGKR